LFTPTVIVMSSMPSLKPKFPTLIVGPWRLSGPSEMVFGVVAPPAAESLMVNICVSPAELPATSVVPFVVKNAFAANVSVTVPSWNSPADELLDGEPPVEGLAWR
jgi:hypothetical protein